MSVSVGTESVIHEPAASRFSLGGSFVSYSLLPPSGSFPGVMDIQHTYTPPSERGRGRAALVTRAAFEWAKGEGLRVRGTCSYVDTFLERGGGEYREVME